MAHYGLIGKLTAIEGGVYELAGILLNAAQLLEHNPDCIHYIVSQINGTNDILVTEVWTSEEAHNASLNPPDIKDLVMSARRLIAGMETIAQTEVLGGKGLSN